MREAALQYKNGRKISAATGGGAIGVLIVWALESFAGVVVPPEAAVAITTLLIWGISILIPDRLEA